MKIKFCGGCNPLYNRKRIYEKIMEENIESNKLIVLNGCQRACKTFEKNEINSQEFILRNLNGDIDEEKFYKWILEKLLEEK